MHKSQLVLIIGTVWPEPESSAAGSRMMQLINLFLTQEWNVVYASAAIESEYTHDISHLGVKTESIKLNDASFDNFLERINPSIVMFDRFMTEEQYGWRVAKVCPNALRMLDTEDLHCLRDARFNALKEKRSLKKTDLISEISKREIASIYRCDISLIISKAEINLLKDVFQVDEELLHYIPFLLDPIKQESINELPLFEQRKDFITLGNFLHKPNVDAITYLKYEIWPIIKEKFPEAIVYNYGAYPGNFVTQLNDPKKGFLIMGRVQNSKHVMKSARVCLAALRFGAGLKGKLVETMQCGTPSITTSIGSEGMHDSLPWNGSIQDDPVEFANDAIRIYNDKDEWTKAQSQGFKILNEMFSKEEHGNALIKRILETIETLNDHRTKNFTGAMLMHHTMTSTMYMSRWIELKNK